MFPLQSSDLVLISHRNGFRLFSKSSLILFDLKVNNISQAIELATKISKDWPQESIQVNENFSNDCYLAIILTQSCNLYCKYCYLHGDKAEWPSKDKKVLLNDKSIKNEIDSIINSHPNKLEINFIGGEVLLERDKLIDISEYATRLCSYHGVNICLGLTTNGSLLDSKFLEWAGIYGVKIMISLDSPPFYHDKYRSRGVWEATFNEIVNKTKGYEEQLFVVSTISHQTPTIQGALEILLSRGYREVSFNLVHTRDNELKITMQDAVRFIEEFWEKQDWFYTNRNRIGNIKQIHTAILERHAKLVPCLAGSGAYAITADGTRYFCHSCAGDSTFKLDRNNELLNHELAKCFSSSPINNICMDCWIKYLCGGECWLIIREYSKNIRNPRCEIIRGIVQLALATFDDNC